MEARKLEFGNIIFEQPASGRWYWMIVSCGEWQPLPEEATISELGVVTIGPRNFCYNWRLLEYSGAGKEWREVLPTVLQTSLYPNNGVVSSLGSSEESQGYYSSSTKPDYNSKTSHDAPDYLKIYARVQTPSNENSGTLETNDDVQESKIDKICSKFMWNSCAIGEAFMTS